MALRLMVDTDSDFFDHTHVEHTKYVKNGTVKIGRCVAVKETHIVVGAAREVVPFDYLIICTGSHYRSDIKTDSESPSRSRQHLRASRRMEAST